MLDDSFKIRYKSVPIAISENNGANPTHLHSHGETEMLIIYKGSTLVTVGGESFKISAGDILLVNPFEPHSLLPDNEKEHLHRCVCFDNSVIADKKIGAKLGEGKLRLKRVIRADTAHADVLRGHFERLYSAVERGEEALLLEVVSHTSLIISYLISNNLTAEVDIKKEDTAFCERVLKFIEENYTEAVTSANVAKALAFNQSYFCRCFKKNFGMSFSEYLTMYRIAASKQRMEHRSLRIADISADCGFTSPEYFTRCFKKYTGLRPKEYIKGQYSTEKRSNS